METKEEFVKNIKEFIAKNKYGLKFICVVSFILIFVIPLLINFFYFIGKSFPIFVFEWDGSDVYLFYGTLLGATATIIAVILTIKFSSKSAECDRKNSIVINHRNEGIKVCYDLIEVCDTLKLENLLELLGIPIEKEEFDADIELILFQNKFRKLSEEIKMCHIKWQFIYPFIGSKTRDFIDRYVIGYQNIIKDLHESIVLVEKHFFIGKNILDIADSFQKTHQPNFIGVLQCLSHEYDCESIWEHPMFKNKEEQNAKN